MILALVNKAPDNKTVLKLFKEYKYELLATYKLSDIVRVSEHLVNDEILDSFINLYRPDDEIIDFDEFGMWLSYNDKVFSNYNGKLLIHNNRDEFLNQLTPVVGGNTGREERELLDLLARY